MSKLIKECPYRSFEGWKRWYRDTYPNTIENATNKIVEMLKKFKDTIDNRSKNSKKSELKT